jgi:hypothetical protein
MTMTPISTEISTSPELVEQVFMGKQSALSDQSRDIRAAMNMMPPEVSKGIINAYELPKPALIVQIEQTIVSRELSIDNVNQGVTLDKEWASGAGQSRSIDEEVIGEKDNWNEPETPGL